MLSSIEQAATEMRGLITKNKDVNLQPICRSARVKVIITKMILIGKGENKKRRKIFLDFYFRLLLWIFYYGFYY